MKKCNNCGVENLDSANFCSACGTSLSAETMKSKASKKMNTKAWFNLVLGVAFFFGVYFFCKIC